MNTPSEPIRLNKRLAEMGLCSRREADVWIENGWVLVNGQPAAMGVKVTSADKVDIDRRAQGHQDTQVTILLHKPMGYVSGQAEDGHEPAITLIHGRSHWREDTSKNRIQPSQLRGLAPQVAWILILSDYLFSPKTDASPVNSLVKTARLKKNIWFA